MISAQIRHAEILKYKTNAEITKNGVILHEEREIRINNRSGLDDANIQILFSKNKIKKLEAELYDKNGQLVRRLKKKDQVIRSAISDISLYEDDFVLEFEMTHNSFPFTIKYSYEDFYTDYIEAIHWVPVENLKVPTLHAELNVSIEEGIKYYSKSYNINNPEPLHWTTSYTDVLKEETWSIDPWEEIPRVIINTDEFYLGTEGSLRSWQDFGNWSYDLNNGLNQLSDKDVNKIKKLTSNLKTEREKVETLYKYMQKNTRYINISIGAGGFKPYPASYVAEKGYGDCKALTNYMKSMLEVVDIPSNYSLVQAGDRVEYLDYEFPNQTFNHIILLVPLENDSIWLDCTSDGPFDYLGSFSQNRPSLVINKDKSKLIQTPAFSKYDVTEKHIYRYTINHDTTFLTDTWIANGPAFDELFSIKTQLNQRDNEYIINNYFKQSDFEITDFHFKKDSLNPASLHLEINQYSTHFLKNMGNDLLFSLIELKLPKLESIKTRKLPVQLDYPIHKEILHVINLDSDLNYEWLPKDHNIESEYGQYRRTVVHKDQEALISISLTIPKNRISLAEYPQFYKFIENIINSEKQLKSTIK